MRMGNYPLLVAITNKNVDMIQLIIDYADKNHIELDINDKEYRFGCYPLQLAILYNNIEMAQLIIDYADKNNITLLYDENNFPVVNEKIVPLLYKNYNEHKIILIFDERL